MVNEIKSDEDKFILAFKDLIEAYSSELLNHHSTKLVSEEPTTISNLMNQKHELDTFDEDKHSDSSLLELRFESFMSTYEKTKFNLGLLPYDRVTSLVFYETPEDIQTIFAEALLKKGEIYYSNRTISDDPELEMHKEGFYKIIRHINLALIQKDIISSKKIDQIIDLEGKNLELNKQYQQLKNDAEKQIEDIKTEARIQYDSLKMDFTKQYESMMGQYISILGIFAGILMGAFGAIQGFTSIFKNADKLSIGKILIVSSIGASSVILILFFLLNGVAKLTGKSLASSISNNLIKKHPTLFIGYSVLIFISLIGASLELSNIKIHKANEGFWWILPAIWAVIAIIVYFVSGKFNNTNTSTKESNSQNSNGNNSISY